MITLPDFTPGDAVVASKALEAIAELATGPNAGDVLRELSAALVHAAGEAARAPEDPVAAAEDEVIGAALAWARTDRAANKAADVLTVAVRAQETATGRPAVRLDPHDGGVYAMGDDSERRSVELAIRTLDITAEAEQSALRRMHDAARRLELADRIDAFEHSGPVVS